MTGKVLSRPGAFNGWFADVDGKPMKVYHGCPFGFNGWEGKQMFAGAPIFFSPDPLVAEHFAFHGTTKIGRFAEEAAAQEAGRFVVLFNGVKAGRFKTMEEAEQHIENIADAVRELQALTGVASDFIVHEERESGYAPTVVPAYLRMENPFDPKNPEHVAMVAKDDYDKGFLSRGDWNSMDPYHEAIRDAGFDGFYEYEFRTRNVTVLTPSQIVCAIGAGNDFVHHAVSRVPDGAANQPSSLQVMENIKTMLEEASSAWLSLPEFERRHLDGVLGKDRRGIGRVLADGLAAAEKMLLQIEPENTHDNSQSLTP